jgi:hypothetical protein
VAGLSCKWLGLTSHGTAPVNHAGQPSWPTTKEKPKEGGKQNNGNKEAKSSGSEKHQEGTESKVATQAPQAGKGQGTSEPGDDATGQGQDPNLKKIRR